MRKIFSNNKINDENASNSFESTTPSMPPNEILFIIIVGYKFRRQTNKHQQIKKDRQQTRKTYFFVRSSRIIDIRIVNNLFYGCRWVDLHAKRCFVTMRKRFLYYHQYYFVRI